LNSLARSGGAPKGRSCWQRESHANYSRGGTGLDNPIVRGFANLARFSGRDTRAQFWPFAGAAFVLYMVIGWGLMFSVLQRLFSLDDATPDSLAVEQTQMLRFLMICLAMFALLVALLAAAAARRLHDTGRSGVWGLIPLPFAAYSGAMFGRIATQFFLKSPDKSLFLSIFASNVLYMAGVVTLVVFLAQRSAPGPNRYG